MHNVSKISFGSTYTIKEKENTPEGYWNSTGIEPCSFDDKAQVYCSPFSLDTLGKSITTMVVSDKFDIVMESYFKQNNIKFHKKTNAELFDINNVKSRIVVPNDKYGKARYLPTTVSVNTKKFDEIFKKSFQYLGDYETMRAKERYDGVREYIKSGLEIHAPEVFIEENNGKPEISFQDGTHRYAFFRDMGMTSIPVAMDLKSCVVAQKYGLLS